MSEEVTTPEVVEPAASPLSEWIASKQEPVESIPNDVETPAQETAPEPEEPKEETEPQSRTARRLINKEKKLREEREAFEAHQNKIESEWKERIETFESAREAAKYDPNGYLDSLGFTDEEKKQVARIMYFELEPDLVTEETKRELDGIKAERRLRRLEAKVEKKPEPEQQPADDGIAVYKQSLEDFALNVKTEDYPQVAEYMDKSELHAQEVIDAMFAIAVGNAKKNPTGNALSPSDCVERLEAYLAEKQQPKVEEPKEPEVEESPKSLRSTTLPQKPTPTNTAWTDDAREERRKLAMERLKGRFGD